jgi:hypothetical protein
MSADQEKQTNDRKRSKLFFLFFFFFSFPWVLCSLFLTSKYHSAERSKMAENIGGTTPSEQQRHAPFLQNKKNDSEFPDEFF